MVYGPIRVEDAVRMLIRIFVFFSCALLSGCVWDAIGLDPGTHECYGEMLSHHCKNGLDLMYLDVTNFEATLETEGNQTWLNYQWELRNRADLDVKIIDARILVGFGSIGYGADSFNFDAIDGTYCREGENHQGIIVAGGKSTSFENSEPLLDFNGSSDWLYVRTSVALTLQENSCMGAVKIVVSVRCPVSESSGKLMHGDPLRENCSQFEMGPSPGNHIEVTRDIDLATWYFPPPGDRGFWSKNCPDCVGLTA